MTKTTSSTPASAKKITLNSLLQGLVRAVIVFGHGGEASLEDIRRSIDNDYRSNHLPRDWKVQVRDMLKHDPDIEKTDEGTWLLRIQDSVET